MSSAAGSARAHGRGARPRLSFVLVAFVPLVFALLAGRAERVASATPTDATGRAEDRAMATVSYGRGLYAPTYTLGLAYPVAPQRSAAVDWELSPSSGVLSPRAAYHLQLTAPRLVTVAASVGVTTALVYRGTLDVSIGPRLGLGVALGPEWLRLDVGGQAGGEIFAHDIGPRFPVRGVATLRLHAFDFVGGVSVRGGYDYEPGRFALLRYEALAFIGTSAFDER